MDDVATFTIEQLRKRATELAPAGRNAFPGICGLISTNGEPWKPASLYDEEHTLNAVRGIFLRMLDALEGIEVYRPSNGTEGEIFMSHWCARCTKDNLDKNTGEGGCDIIALTMALDENDEDYPRAWRLAADGSPLCSEFEAAR